MVKLQLSKGRYWITIPITKVKIANFEKGDSFDVEFDKTGKLILTKI